MFPVWTLVKKKNAKIVVFSSRIVEAVFVQTKTILSVVINKTGILKPIINTVHAF